MDINKVTIIGLGLIGGSLARAFHERLHVREIIAINKDLNSINEAVADGVISRGFSELDPCIWDSDLIFICTPVKLALEYLKIIAPNVKPDCIITDVGSTKSEIIDCINAMPDAPIFVGGHPMAGTEKAGYLASFSHLFENAYYMLTPSKTSTRESIEKITDLVSRIGAIPVEIEAREHDRVTGCISHLPHVIASALVNMVKRLDSSDGKMQMLAAGGFKDITRIASSSPEMWESIVFSNKHQIEDLLKTYVHMLDEFRTYIINNEPQTVYEFFKTSKGYRDSFPDNRKGLIFPLNDLLVDVVDKPGIIGEIATILGSHNINIKNINVSNSREFEQGCIRITLPDRESVNSAYALLESKGYRVFRKD